MQILDHHRHRAAILSSRPDPQNIHAGHEGTVGVHRTQLTGQLIGNVSGQLVRLGPHHAKPGRQCRHSPTDQGGLARTGRPLHPHHPRPAPRRRLGRPSDNRPLPGPPYEPVDTGITLRHRHGPTLPPVPSQVADEGLAHARPTPIAHPTDPDGPPTGGPSVANGLVRKAEPLLNVRLFARRPFLGDSTVMGLLQFGLLPVVLYSSIYAQNLLGYSPVVAETTEAGLLESNTTTAQAAVDN